MKIYRLFKNYSLRSFKEHRFLVLACIFSVILAASSTFFMLVVADIYSRDASENISKTNGSSEIKIQDNDYFKNNFTEKQIEGLHSLTDEIDLTTGRYLQTNIIAEKSVDNIFLNILIDSNCTETNLEKNEIILTENIAKRLNIECGEKVYLKLHSSSVKDSTFNVTKIIKQGASINTADTEQETLAEIIGSGWIYCPNELVQNFAYIDQVNDSSSSDIFKILNEEFSPEFSVRSLEQLKKKISPRINLQINAIKMIGTLTFIISGICMSCAFLFFITQRVNDYILMKVYGMKKTFLFKLILLEITSITLVGIVFGITVGIFSLYGYFYLQKTLFSLTFLSIVTYTNRVLLLIATNNLIFSLIPITIAGNITFYQYKNRNLLRSRDTRLVKMTILIIVCLAILASIETKSFVGGFSIVFVGLICIILFTFSYFTLKLVGKLCYLFRNKYYLFFLSLKYSTKEIAFTMMIFSLTMVFITLLIVIPNILSSSMVNPASDSDQLQSTYYTLANSKDLVKQEVRDNKITNYSSTYMADFELVSVNGKHLTDLIQQSNVAEIYADDTENLFKNLTLKIIEHLPKEVERQLVEGEMNDLGKEDSILVNPYMYRNAVTINKGDQIEIMVDGMITKFVVSGLLKNDSFSKGIYVCLQNSEILNAIENENSQIQFTFYDRNFEKISQKLLMIDSNGYFEKESHFSTMMSEFFDNQKLIITNLVIVGIFSSIFLLVSIQFISNYRNRNDYKIMFRFGLSKKKLMKIIFFEKSLISIVQSSIIFIIIEPVRFLTISEFSQIPYSFDVKLFFLAYLFVIFTHFGSFLITLIDKDN